jgi:hypothetical protein
MKKPEIESTKFGSITIDGQVYEYDVMICLDGKIKKRKKKLSKAIYGTSHMLSLDEAEYIFEKGAGTLVIGTGQYGMLELSPEARDFFQRNHCMVELLPTPKAIKLWERVKGGAIGLFHVTC